jgi:lipopolysaccharide assembly protein A
MRQLGLVLALCLATAIALFAIQNAGPVMLRLGFWAGETSLVVVILVAAAVGAILASLLGLPGWFRDRRRLRQQGRELQALRAARPPEPAPAAGPGGGATEAARPGERSVGPTL